MTVRRPQRENLKQKPKQRKKEEEYKPCPPENATNKNRRFEMIKRLERLVKFERECSEGSCDPIYEDVPFIEQYLPTPSVLINLLLLLVGCRWLCYLLYP